jgi:hypothetical protein
MKKKFDAVEFQRKARAEVSRKYRSNRRAFLRQMKEKYGSLREAKAARRS